MLIALHKPYGHLSQFTPDQPGQQTLSSFNLPPKVFPIGRLDLDSEGLLLLGDEPQLVSKLLEPSQRHPRTYHTQVEGIPTHSALTTLRKGGILLRHHRTLPCLASILDPQPSYPPRIPPIRSRQSIPDCWISLTLTEGKNRQVRRMTAAVGFPTLRLIRVAIGNLELADLAPGSWKELDQADRKALGVTFR